MVMQRCCETRHFYSEGISKSIILQMNSQLLLWSWKVADCSPKETYLANVSTGCSIHAVLRARVKLRFSNRFMHSRPEEDWSIHAVKTLARYKFLCYQDVYKSARSVHMNLQSATFQTHNACMHA